MVSQKGTKKSTEECNMYVYNNEIVKEKIGIIYYTYVYVFLYLFGYNFLYLNGGLVKI